MKEIPLTKGVVALVDDTDFDDLSRFKWCAHTAGNGKNIYAKRHLPGSARGAYVLMHQVIMGAKGCDHRDGNGLNNQRENLRVCTQSQNMMNQRHRIGTTSKYKGVAIYRESKMNPWQAGIKLNYKRINLGVFGTEEEAALAYNLKATEIFGEFARLNEIGG